MTKPSVFISGSAGGIGAATARKFAAEGYLVGIYDIDDVGVKALVTELGADCAVGGHLDVTVPEEWEKALKAFVRKTGGNLDILINNAGILRAGAFEDVDLAKHRLTIDINVMGVINGTHAAHKYLKVTPNSQVVNLCSASAIYGQPEIATYSASKFAVRGLTEALELEWRKQGIRVQAVWPLWVNTHLLDDNDSTSASTLGVKLTVDDVAKAIWKATRPRGLAARPIAKVHTAVGIPAKLFATAANLSPAWAAREINRLINKA